MPFLPTEPQNGEVVDADFLRSQFNALNDQTKKVGAAGLQIVGNTEVGTTVGLVFLKSDGVTDSGYRINYNDDTDGVLIVRDGVAVAGIDASGLRVFEAVALHGLPATDPHVADRLWNDAGTVKVSAG